MLEDFIGLDYGDPPCWYSGDHYWESSGACTSCGKRLRCFCGAFISPKTNRLRAHYEKRHVPELESWVFWDSNDLWEYHYQNWVDEAAA